ncbi:MAG: aspartate 1-decarboxylase [Mastigocoleus sp. MO_167.B18]|uniref:aspartate 1-decarboxylase n=1 Tax=Mastigocoleus sp. MO_188.B34 TaxID=3036635 RepID=UPI002606C62B|nr:aspartate 1-decarboxylase [Mastigocoleus sp. MO_188.B34]MDJ0695037.1 aspartate 1-decarboxylase [Mastigocoleus sp. MO_188.B34]MDJ0773450.1 aspartate 1-decarboxylase [Mastigocoleus sp. MO_167.B18]
MQRTLLLAKIHDCTLTGANPDYVGSVSIDQMLLEKADILPFEQVQVVNITNGVRLVTYAIPAPPNSGAIELNGAAARKGVIGDRLIIMSYGQFTFEELKTHSPKVVIVNRNNELLEVRRYDDLLDNV